QALYTETPDSVLKRENAAALRKAGALGMTTDGRPSKKQRRQIEHFRGAQEQ
ncbi:MAG: RNA-binding protein, partial [Pseudomonas sp.]|nr:RNA-binding protein [Pseudomonas sp.]